MLTFSRSGSGTSRASLARVSHRGQCGFVTWKRWTKRIFRVYCLMCEAQASHRTISRRKWSHETHEPSCNGSWRYPETIPACDVNKDHILAFRFQDGDHTKRFPARRRITFQNRRYRLVSMYMGQKDCGHQIGVASPTGHWRDWVIDDADLHKDGIGPIFIRFDGEFWMEHRWEAWNKLVHVTKHGLNRSKFCIITPHNERNDKLNNPEKHVTKNKGTCSVDMIYVPTK